MSIVTGVFGAEYVATKTGIDTLRGPRYKLRMIGFATDGAKHVYGDDMSIINNASRPESMLQKKSNTVCYHSVRESVNIPGVENSADLTTKVMSGSKPQLVIRQVKKYLVNQPHI